MNKTRILIADDDRVILVTLAEGLEKAGYDVITASDGKQAIELCETEKPDLAILDIRMPNMTGIEAARQLQTNTNIPFIFLSAYDDSDTVKSAVEEGALGYLVKPIDAKQIIPTIESALARANDFKSGHDLTENLNIALQTRRETDVAIGLIMERYHLTKDLAFDALRSYSRSRSRKVSDLAQEIIQGADSMYIPQNYIDK